MNIMFRDLQVERSTYWKNFKKIKKKNNILRLWGYYFFGEIVSYN